MSLKDVLTHRLTCSEESVMPSTLALGPSFCAR